ncbi:MAG TPA: ammonium transporter [Geomonas sp.]|nr:ammonium transporter [Geomonas sp.]
METRLRLSEKFSRLGERMRDPEWRRYGYLLAGGKMLGLGLVFAVMVLASNLFGSEVMAADPVLKANDIVNPINTLWTLLAAFLVFGMQVGFTMLEAGFCRGREAVNVLMECVVDTALCGLLFYAWGFAFMFGSGTPLIGTKYFFLQGVPATYESTGVSFLAFWLFQFAFADTCSTITSGAMIGRTGFVGDLIYSFFVSGFIYPIIGHWAWGPDGFLATMGSKGMFLADLGTGFHDFAGSTVVHTIGGFVALAGGMALGPRIGRKFKRDGGAPMLPHDLVMATVGGLILWFGWYGFNPGSTLSIMDADGAGRVAANTTLAACAAALTAMFYGYPKTKKWDISYTVNGFLAGLVAITCPCYWVSPTGSIAIGAVAGVLVVAGVDLLEWLRIDDPIGAVPVHGLNGIWGTLSLGLFACGKYGVTGPFAADNSAPLTGLFYGGSVNLLAAQAIGSAIITVATFSVALVLMYGLNALKILRVEKHGELIGIDNFEHGIGAYPEYALKHSAIPSGDYDTEVAMAAQSDYAAPKRATIPTAATTH